MGHVELHPPVREIAVAAYQTAEVLTRAEGLGHVLGRWLNVVVGYDGIRCRVPVPM